ncbi:MAG: shikimate kinase, partial [Ruthenibacterium sp.]
MTFAQGAGLLIAVIAVLSVCASLHRAQHPLRTALLLDAQARGLPTEHGLRMLAVQAAGSAELFTGAAIPPQRVEQVLRALIGARENWVLVGMPGCGKTRTARLLAARTGRELLDTDAMVVARTGKSIPQLFTQEGEAAFRRLEAEAVAEAGARTGVIIATGGGAPLTEQNRRALRQNGRV